MTDLKFATMQMLENLAQRATLPKDVEVALEHLKASIKPRPASLVPSQSFNFDVTRSTTQDNQFSGTTICSNSMQVNTLIGAGQ